MSTLLLFPGAGASRDQATLVAVDRAVAPEWATVRADFPYRKEGRKAPDRPPKLMAAVRDELADLDGPVVVGGRSMGGRICSLVAAGADGEPPEAVIGVLLISYPLHPPGKPDTLRVEHLPDITVPCLFIHGTRDPFGTPDELSRWTKTIAGAVTHHWIEGRGHDLKGADREVAAVAREWLLAR